MLDYLKNTFLYRNKYKTHSEAVIIACFYNPENNPYRIAAFYKWYNSIKHLNHRIVECIIGGGTSQLPQSPYISAVHTDSTLWHKESLLNRLIYGLPTEFKYVFWLDTDVLFSNDDWMVRGVQELQGNKLIQPFNYCYHLNRDEVKPKKVLDYFPASDANKVASKYKAWRSFCSNYVCDVKSDDYNTHGHVGFGWAARRSVLDECPLFDHALVGGADHIIAHAAAGQIPHKCIENSFGYTKDITDWSNRFYKAVGGYIGYVEGDLYHLWHGDIEKRQYLKRILEFKKESESISTKDSNGLYVSKTLYVKNYMREREIHHLDSVTNLFDDTPVDLLSRYVFGVDIGENAADLGVVESEENTYNTTTEDTWEVPSESGSTQDSWEESTDTTTQDNFS